MVACVGGGEQQNEVVVSFVGAWCTNNERGVDGERFGGGGVAG